MSHALKPAPGGWLWTLPLGGEILREREHGVTVFLFSVRFPACLLPGLVVSFLTPWSQPSRFTEAGPKLFQLQAGEVLWLKKWGPPPSPSHAATQYPWSATWPVFFPAPSTMGGELWARRVGGRHRAGGARGDTWVITASVALAFLLQPASQPGAWCAGSTFLGHEVIEGRE